MAVIAVVSDNVSLVRGEYMGEHPPTLYTGTAPVVGDIVREDTTTGQLTLADGSAAADAGARRWVVLGIKNKTLYAQSNCVVDIGESLLAGADFDDPVYLADTPGKISLDILDSTLELIVGYVTSMATDADGTTHKGIQFLGSS